MEPQRVVLKALIRLQRIFQHWSSPFLAYCQFREDRRIMPISIQVQSVEFHARWGDGENYVAGVGIIGESACWRLCRARHKNHTFATRALEKCSTRRETVARHFVALATYLGHSDIAHTYWYLEATPQLMTHIAAAAEELVAQEGL
jgi:hypothetical protein